MALYKPLLDELGITYLHYITLMVLWEENDQRVSDICSKTDIDVGTISPMLKRMEKLGLIVRTRDTIDERIVRVSLTDKGYQMREKALLIAYRIKACFTQDGLFEKGYEDMETITSLLDSLLQSFEICNK